MFINTFKFEGLSDPITLIDRLDGRVHTLVHSTTWTVRTQLKYCVAILKLACSEWLLTDLKSYDIQIYSCGMGPSNISLRLLSHLRVCFGNLVHFCPRIRN